MATQSELLTAEEVEEFYGLTALTLTRWIRLGRIRPVRVRSGWRFAAADIANAIEVSVYQEPGSSEKW